MDDNHITAWFVLSHPSITITSLMNPHTATFSASNCLLIIHHSSKLIPILFLPSLKSGIQRLLQQRALPLDENVEGSRGSEASLQGNGVSDENGSRQDSMRNCRHDERGCRRVQRGFRQYSNGHKNRCEFRKFKCFASFMSFNCIFQEAQHHQHERELAELKAQISSLKIQYEGSRNEIIQRDQRLQQLAGDLKMLEDRCMQAENQSSQNQRLNEEIERLNSALRDIAHAVVQDADSGDAETTQHLHLSQPMSGVPPRSPKRGAIRASQAFAEGTISAVQAALHKYQLSIHDLQVKLQSNSESLQLAKKQLETSENTRENVTMKLNELTEKLDNTNYQLAELMKERDSLQKTLDDIRSDKHSVERGKAELNSIVSWLGDYR